MRIHAADGTPLGATLIRGRGVGASYWAVIGGATAVPHGYYRPLSEWLAATLGINVLAFDYRGIGASKPATLRGYVASMRDWADDLAGAVDHAADRGPTVVIGHSFGGQAFGMTPAHERTLGLYTFASGAGWHGHMSPAEGLKARLMWNVLAPPLVAALGYLPYSKVMSGEDLPKGVYRDWKRWCSYPRYFHDDPLAADIRAEFARVEAPVVGVNSVDDPWAGEASARALSSGYADYTQVMVNPADLGLARIGHMSYVRPPCRPLWTPMARWIDGRLGLSEDAGTFDARLDAG